MIFLTRRIPFWLIITNGLIITFYRGVAIMGEGMQGKEMGRRLILVLTCAFKERRRPLPSIAHGQERGLLSIMIVSIIEFTFIHFNWISISSTNQYLVCFQCISSHDNPHPISKTLPNNYIGTKWPLPQETCKYLGSKLEMGVLVDCKLKSFCCDLVTSSFPPRNPHLNAQSIS